MRVAASRRSESQAWLATAGNTWIVPESIESAATTAAPRDRNGVREADAAIAKTATPSRSCQPATPPPDPPS